MSERQEDGFGVVTKDVALDPTISTTAKAVYLTLAVHRAGDFGRVFPSIATIMGALGISRATAKRALVELEGARVLKRVPRFVEGRQTSNEYVLSDAVAKRRKR